MGLNDLLNINKSLEILKSRMSITRQRLEEVRMELNDAKTQIKKQNNRISELESIVQREFVRRDEWERKEAEVHRLANGRKVWVIKCPAPDSALKYHGGKYGDYAYCMNIKKNLEQLGYYVVLDCYEDWNCSINADVVLVIRGTHDFHPDRRDERTKFVLWMVSHPEMVTIDELNLYDLVLVDSEPYAVRLKQEANVPVEPFYVLTDTDMFYPQLDSDDVTSPTVASSTILSNKPFDVNAHYNRVFIGNTRGILRDCIKWCNDNHIEVDVWGAEWEKFFPNSLYVHLHGQVAYEQIPEIYRHSRFVINDHYEEMLETGMLNNRFPEVLLSGIPMICDWSESFEKKYGDMVLFYRNEAEFLQCMEEMETRYDELKANVMQNQENLRATFDFQMGIQRMVKLIEESGNSVTR